MVKIPALDLLKIQEQIKATVVRGNAAGVAVKKIAEPRDADSDSISFLISESFVKDVQGCRAQVFVIQKALLEKVIEKIPQSVSVVMSCEDAYVALAKVTELAVQKDSSLDWEVSTNVVSAKIDASAKIGPGCVISNGVRIGANVKFISNVTIGSNVEIGEGSTLFPGVVIYPNTSIGKRTRIHANAVIGSDGFGYARGNTGATKIWHLGKVIIGDDVEIGSGSMVDRGTLKDTIIENGVKIDNLVQIAHNVHIKAHSVICAQTGIAGNAKLGIGTLVAAKAGIGDKVEIGDRAIIGPQTGISKDVAAGEIMMGTFLGRPRREWWKTAALVDRLPEIYDRLKKIEKKLLGKE